MVAQARTDKDGEPIVAVVVTNTSTRPVVFGGLGMKYNERLRGKNGHVISGLIEDELLTEGSKAERLTTLDGGNAQTFVSRPLRWDSLCAGGDLTVTAADYVGHRWVLYIRRFVGWLGAASCV
jgi:hypothetical protein